jgi:chaperone modulatory protein CbpM
MNIESADAQWLDEQVEITIEELVELSGLPEDALRDLVECGVLVPTQMGPARWSVTSGCMTTLLAARRLREDFDLETNALALALRLLDRVRELEAELRESRARRQIF